MQIQCLYDTALTYTAYTKLRVFVPFLDLILLLTGVLHTCRKAACVWLHVLLFVLISHFILHFGKYN